MSDSAPSLSPIGFYKSGRPIFPIMGGSVDTPPAETLPADGNPPADPPAETPPAPAAQPGTAPVDWKAAARKWEDRAKANNKAAEERDAFKAQLDELNGKLTETGNTAAQAAAELARYKVAVEKSVPVELLPAGADEQTLSEFADNLLAFRGQQGNFTVPNVGQTPPPPPSREQRAAQAEASGDFTTALSEKTGQLFDLLSGQTS